MDANSHRLSLWPEAQLRAREATTIRTRTTPHSAPITYGGAPSGGISVGGGLPTGVTYLLDGSTHNDPFNNLNLPLPFPDATQEFKLETGSLPAQYGDHAAAAVNVVTKSGTNSYHGDAFEFVRNYIFNAREADLAARDSLKRNQFGGILGGPIKRDKIFFFAGYQQTIQKSNPATSGNVVPTDLMEGEGAGTNPDCASLPSAPAQCLDFTAITNPANKCTGYSGITLRAPFVGNVAPLSARNPQGLNMVNFFPKVASATNPCGTISIPSGANLNEQLGVGRLDYQLSSKQTINARYLMGNSDQPLVGDSILEAAEQSHQKNRAQSLSLGDTYTITPTVINSVHVTAIRTRNIREIAPFFDPTTLGIMDTANNVPYIPNFMGFSIANGVSGGTGTPIPGTSIPRPGNSLTIWISFAGRIRSLWAPVTFTRS